MEPAIRKRVAFKLPDVSAVLFAKGHRETDARRKQDLCAPEESEGDCNPWSSDPVESKGGPHHPWTLMYLGDLQGVLNLPDWGELPRLTARALKSLPGLLLRSALVVLLFEVLSCVASLFLAPELPLGLCFMLASLAAVGFLAVRAIRHDSEEVRSARHPPHIQHDSL